jgi:hypothetical protein
LFLRGEFQSDQREASMRLSDFAVLSFDCYGSLIDWESGIWAALQPLRAKSGGALAELVAATHRAERNGI